MGLTARAGTATQTLALVMSELYTALVPGRGATRRIFGAHAAPTSTRLGARKIVYFASIPQTGTARIARRGGELNAFGVPEICSAARSEGTHTLLASRYVAPSMVLSLATEVGTTTLVEAGTEPYRLTIIRPIVGAARLLAVDALDAGHGVRARRASAITHVPDVLFGVPRLAQGFVGDTIAGADGVEVVGTVNGAVDASAKPVR